MATGNWMRKVDMVFENYFGLGIDDLPDFDYNVCYDSDMTAMETLKEYLDFYPEFRFR